MATIPRHIMLDLWGSATIRTGGEDFAQALALLGVAPRWDTASARVIGFEILPQARLDFPRVDVTLQVSGLFRDMFPEISSRCSTTPCAPSPRAMKTLTSIR